MKYLLDTNAWIWAMADPEKIPAGVRKRLFDTLPVGLSAISPWEVAKKESKGLLRLNRPIAQWIEQATRKQFISLMPLSAEVSVESCHLPGEFHKDPADQIIVATARIHGLSVITSDRRIREYPSVKSLWS